MIATLPRHCGRDWCGDSQVNGGARSVGVSSTGLSRSNLAANQSVVSSASGSYQGVQDHHSKNYLKDLKNFSELFNEPLVIAKQCIREVDLDLYELLQQTELQANDLMVAAQAVTWKLSAMACNSLEVLPTLLWIARGSGEAHELSAVLEVHNSVTAMRKETQVVRTSYIDLLNQVRYLGQCTQITMDQMMIEEMPAPVEDESGSLETKRVQQQDERSFEKLLRLALMHLDAVCVTLEECSDFWLMLHNAELQLRKLEKEASSLDNGLQKLQSFCERLRDFCKEHCGVPSSSFIVVPRIQEEMGGYAGKMNF